MRFVIRKAEKKDMERVLELIKELAIFEREPEAVEVTIEQLQHDGFSNNPAFFCLVAEVNNIIEGIALFYYRYSTWTGIALHLEDLIVSKNERGKGLGTALLDEVIKFGYEKGVKRISWDVLDWNTPAIDFYKKKGAKILKDWDVVHLDKEGIENYISKIN